MDQDINRKEFYERLENIIINFNRLKSEEKLKLKQWIINVNSNDDEFKNNIEKIFNLDKKGVLEMTSNISKGLEKLKQEAINEGKIEGKIELLIELLTKKFKVIPEEYIRIFKTMPEESIKAITTDIFEIQKIQDLERYFPQIINKK